MEYDYLIIGSGLFGAVFAYELKKAGKKVLVIEKRNHIGGNCYTEKKDDIHIHKYGAHIFHTSEKKLWDYVNQFATFSHYKYNPKVVYDKRIYSFPINLLTLQQVFVDIDISSPNEARSLIHAITNIYNKYPPKNFEEYLLGSVGKELYEKFYYGYSKKQWGVEPKELPVSIAARLPIRFNYDDNYFFDSYQGIPIGGYTQIFEKLLKGIEVKLSTDFFEDKERFESLADKIVYTGKIDELCGYKYGHLNYRSLNWETLLVDKNDFQGCAVLNFANDNVRYTRRIEHKHFEFIENNLTYISYEYPETYIPNSQTLPLYPMSDNHSKQIYTKYKNCVGKTMNKYILGGRLAEYKYYDMHQVIASALTRVKFEINKV